MSESDQETKNRRPIILWALLAIGLVFSIVLSFVYVLGTKSARKLSSGNLSIMGFEGLIRDGDDEFKSGNYDQALIQYKEANRILADFVGFESQSFSKDARLLQHYHNTGTTLKVRIDLTLLAKEVTHLRPSSMQSPGFPPEGLRH